MSQLPYEKRAIHWDSNQMVEYLYPRVHPWVLTRAAQQVILKLIGASGPHPLEPVIVFQAIDDLYERTDRPAAISRLTAALRRNASPSHFDNDLALSANYLGENALALAMNAPWVEDVRKLKAPTALAISYAARSMRPESINPPQDLLFDAGFALYKLFYYDPAKTKYRVILGEILCAERIADADSVRQVAWDYAEEHDLYVVTPRASPSAFGSLMGRR